jgi:N-methylhydantoinase A/oxoprolinase/acetone carboxylase beta subunit
METSYLVAVDIGGTFTDMVLMDLTSGESRVTKVLTTPSAPVECVRTGMSELLAAGGLDASQLESIVHATTLATNIITEGKGSRVAMLTTKGFRDIIETRSEGRYDGYDLQIVLPPPLVERRHRHEVVERLDHRV